MRCCSTPTPGTARNRFSGIAGRGRRGLEGAPSPAQGDRHARSERGPRRQPAEDRPRDGTVAQGDPRSTPRDPGRIGPRRRRSQGGGGGEKAHRRLAATTLRYPHRQGQRGPESRPVCSSRQTPSPALPSSTIHQGVRRKAGLAEGFLRILHADARRLLPPKWYLWVEELPAWTRVAIAGQAVWQWSGLLLGTRRAFRRCLVDWRRRQRRATSAPAGRGFASRMVSPLLLILVCLLALALIDELNITGVPTCGEAPARCLGLSRRRLACLSGSAPARPSGSSPRPASTHKASTRA